MELACFVPVEIPPRLKGDPTRLRQIVTNLLGNAIKFTERGEVVVRVRLLERADAKVMIRFEVQDTGIGIAPEAVSRLFRPFTQADSSTTRRFGGTGLGLSICKQLIETMDGEIGLDSVLGQGSTFWFTLPFVESSEAPVASRQGPHLRGLRVLIVDDNATNRTILKHYVETWGMVPTAAAGGAEALEILREGRAMREALRPRPARYADAGDGWTAIGTHDRSGSRALSGTTGDAELHGQARPGEPSGGGDRREPD